MKAIYDGSYSRSSSSNENSPAAISNDLESSAPKVVSTYNSQDETSIDEAVGIITNNIELDSCLQLVTKTLDVTDDPTLNPFTFRAFFLGIGLSAFGAVIAEIFYFKPQPMPVNTVFLEIIGFILGEITTFIPRWGPIGRLLNPGPFNIKEHVFMTIMASSSAVCALGTEQLAAQSLYYNEAPNAGSAIFMLLASQMLGYGFLGVMRKVFVYPTKMLWPSQLPLASLFQALHLNKTLAKKRLMVFWYVFSLIIVWEILPEYIFPLTAGISIFCLAQQHSTTFTYIFGGANGNEGLGILSWCMDWQYIGTQSLILPLDTLLNQFIGYVGGICLMIGVYYSNVWASTLKKVHREIS
jgi:OPT family oligopeptide transporter